MSNLEQKALYISSNPVSIAEACRINEVSVLEADIINNIYKGEITLTDLMEGGSPSKEGWIAKPGTQEHIVFGKKYFYDINPANPFWGKDKFTLISAVDKDMRHHIIHGILEVNPDLPYKQ